ncbi:MAG: hypothetical protein K2O40_04860 [Lachnospiraceae bacterium]|nr:hypothetical protein [Lachnospiraceae bacterium]
MTTKLSTEQIAHDLTVALCSKSFPSENFPNGDSDISSFVQEYRNLYDYVLKVVKKEL